ncbi:MAG: helix-turn-helix domain-containing protein, partial [Bacteroidales bacterium]|nr:helix-turn-helix domain-containing protein [Bacteroidales bacterium]
QQTFDKGSSLADADLRKYFAFFVLSYTERGSTDVVIKSTQQELSDFFGVARPSLLKTVNELRDEGVIEYRRKELSVLNMEKLAEILHS